MTHPLYVRIREHLFLSYNEMSAFYKVFLSVPSDMKAGKRPLDCDSRCENHSK